MNYAQFKESLSLENPPGNLSVYLKALWFDAKDDWEKAHTTIQNIEDKNAAWIHAYLHRKEGDLGNTRYRYARAGKRIPGYSLQEEWEEIVRALIS